VEVVICFWMLYQVTWVVDSVLISAKALFLFKVQHTMGDIWVIGSHFIEELLLIRVTLKVSILMNFQIDR